MNTKLEMTLLAMTFLNLAACAQTSASREADLPAADERVALAAEPAGGGPTWEARLFTESTELDEIEVNDTGFADMTLKDEKLTRSGVKVSYGIEELKGSLSVYSDDFLGEDSGTGVSLGLAGSVPIQELDFGPQGSVLRFQYGLSAGVTGDERVSFAGQQGDFAYITARSEIGLALDLQTGWVVSAGVVAQSLSGSVEFDLETDHEWEDDDVEGDYTSGYVGLDYHLHGQPWTLSTQALIGESQGLGFSLGWGF